MQERLTVFMRYVGQGWEIPVVLESASLEAGAAEDLRARFEAAYQELFGRIIEGLEVEATNWAVNVSTQVADVKRVDAPAQLSPVGDSETRSIFDAGLRARVDAVEVRRDDLSAGMAVSGPAVITEDETSTIIAASYAAVMQADGALLISRKESAA